MKIREAKNIVHELLIVAPETRDNDFLLYALFCQRTAGNLKLYYKPFLSVLEMSDVYKLTPFETITRCRRLLQKNYEELRGDKYVARKEKQKEYVVFSKEV